MPATRALGLPLALLLSLIAVPSRAQRPALDESFLKGFQRLEVPEVVVDNLGGGPPRRQRCYSAKADFRATVEAVRATLDGRYWTAGEDKSWFGPTSLHWWSGRDNLPFHGWTIEVAEGQSRPDVLFASDLVAVGQPAQGWTSISILEPMGPNPRLREFEPEDITLESGMLRTQLDEAKEFYLRIPNDDLLLGFRRRAGLPAPGRELGGWYSDDAFNAFGQILSGLARMYATTRDPACKAKAEVLEANWAKCIAPDGFFYYSTKPNAPHYTFDKMVGALVDMAVYCESEGVEAHLSRITDWAIKNLDRTNAYALNVWQGSTEWYTLSENLYRAYILTHEHKYGDFAKVWEYTAFWDRLAKGAPLFHGQGPGTESLPTAYHAYSHVNTLAGAARAYLATGEKHYLDTVTRGYDFLQTQQCFATGGYGPDERLALSDEVVHRLETTTHTFETQCGSWAAFKLCRLLILITGDARYGDWVERLAINGIAATIPMSASGGVMYNSDYNPFGGQKVNDGQWTCCTGTRPMAVAVLPELIYFRERGGGVRVNLFVPSTLTFNSYGGAVRLRQSTRFPEAPSTTLTFEEAPGEAMALSFRRPGWLAGPMTAKLNGKPLALVDAGKNWMRVSRRWRKGDVLELELPMEFRSVPIDPKKTFPTAITYGPVAMAFRSEFNPGGAIEFDKLAANFEKMPGEALSFRLRSQPGTLARPYYAYKEGEDYFLYLDPSLPKRIGFRRLETAGRWNDGGQFWFSNEVGASCEAKFDGTGVRWLGW